MAIHFYESLVEEALKAIRENHELSEVYKDIDNVLFQMEQVRFTNLMQENDCSIRSWKLQQARDLDKAMREKYPVIDNMLDIADRLIPKETSPMAGYQTCTSETREYKLLKQDYCGILCHVLLKKKITETVEEFIEKVD